MSESWDDDLKKLKDAVPVPPDFLKRVRAQIAQPSMASHKERAQGGGGVWWKGWMDFFGQNPFPVAAAAALVILAGAALLWKTDQPTAPPHIPLTRTQKTDTPWMQATRDIPTEIIVRIELPAGESPVLSTASTMASEPLLMDSADKSVADLSHKHESQKWNTTPPTSPSIAVSVIRSSSGLDETVRIVEQIARHFSGVLVDDKLAGHRRDLNRDAPVTQTVIVEIDPGKKEAFLTALSNSIVGGVSAPQKPGQMAETVQQTAETQNGSGRLQLNIQIGSPPVPK